METLRYAPLVAKPLDAAAEATPAPDRDPAWLRPYTGYPDAAGASDLYAPFRGEGAPFHTVGYDEINSSPAAKLEFVERVLVDGAALVARRRGTRTGLDQVGVAATPRPRRRGRDVERLDPSPPRAATRGADRPVDAPRLRAPPTRSRASFTGASHRRC